MKKLIIAATLLLASFGLANAQRPVIKVDANVGFSNIIQKFDDKTIENNMILGYRVGVGAEFGFGSPGLYLNPGIVFTSKGAKAKDVTVPVVGTVEGTTTRLHYIQVPVHIGYRADFAPKMAVSFQAGPYLGVGLTGKIGDSDENVFSDHSTTILGQTVTTKGMNRIDVGLGIQAAYHYDMFYAQVGYEYGFLNMSNTDKLKLNNNNFFMGVGVRF